MSSFGGSRIVALNQYSVRESKVVTRWHTAATSEELVEGAAKEVVVEGRIVALFRSNGELHALDGMCAHQGGPIADGFVQDKCVTCPWHGWQYELETGIQTINRQPLQETFNVREKNGLIEIEL